MTKIAKNYQELVEGHGTDSPSAVSCFKPPSLWSLDLIALGN